MLVEQAIFTSTQTDRAEGYQLVAASSGLASDDRRELAVWGPSHDSLAYSEPQASSVNFFPLSSGLYCVSRTVTCAGEYSGRGNLRYYTQCLVVPPETFRRFTNNPFAVLRAALAQGSLEPLERVPPELPSLRLVGRCATVDHGLLTDLAHDPGVEWLAAALAAMLISKRMALATSSSHSQRLVAGLFNCLPVEWRGEFSFTTGLRMSPRRPFRLVCVPPEPAEIRRAERQHGPVFAIAGQPTDSAGEHGWAGYVAEVLRTGRTSTLATSLARPRLLATLAELDELGDRLRAEMSGGNQTASVDELADRQGDFSASEDRLVSGENSSVIRFPRLAKVIDAVEATKPKRTEFVAEAAPDIDLMTLAPQEQQRSKRSDEFELLDLVDDAVFEAIAGNASAVERLRALWPQAAEQLPADVLEDSRQHYLRHALGTWRQGQEPETIASAERGPLVLDVLSIVLAELR